MRLCGIAFREPRIWLEDSLTGQDYDPLSVSAPLRAGYIPVDQFTGIIGRNDSGKTKLLMILEDALNPTREPTASDRRTSILFFHCSRQELETLTEQAVLDLTEFEEEAYSLEEEPVAIDRAHLWDRRPSIDGAVLSATRLSPALPAVEQYSEALSRAWIGDSAAYDRLLALATGMRKDTAELSDLTVALFRRDNGWGIYWCVPPISECTEDDLRALRECRLGPGLSLGDIVRDDELGRKLVRTRATFGWADEAPIPVAPVGHTSLPLTPRTLRATDLSTVVRRLEQVLSEFALRTLHLEALVSPDFTVLDDNYRIPGYGVSHEATREVLSEIWLRRTPVGGYEVNPDILLQVKQVQILANELLPDFIGTKYELTLSVRPPTAWTRGSRLELRLIKRHGARRGKVTVSIDGKAQELESIPVSSEFLSGHGFPAEEVAQGFKLWIGIAITEASRIVEIIGGQLDYYIDDLIDTHIVGYLEEYETEAFESANRALGFARTVADSMEEVTGGEELYAPLEQFLEWLRLSPYSRMKMEQHRGLIYLLDEPERHLHPALQRNAAEWLQERLESSGFQAVVATHSLSFMSVSGNASFTYLVREPEAPTVLLSINPRELDSLSLAATELGIDRGELLSLINLFLWVEGYSEQVILETLFGPELRELGVKVIPLHGHPGARGILDSRIHSFTSARAAVWLDAISPEFVAEAEAKPEVKTDSPEEKTLAQVIRSARENEIPIVPISVEYPGDDVFDLLDDLAIESEYPNYPGHEEARRLWAEAREKGAKVGSRKDFWAQKFKTPITPESCRLIASRMRQEGRITPQLASVLEQCKAVVIS